MLETWDIGVYAFLESCHARFIVPQYWLQMLLFYYSQTANFKIHRHFSECSFFLCYAISPRLKKEHTVTPVTLITAVSFINHAAFD